MNDAEKKAALKRFRSALRTYATHERNHADNVRYMMRRDPERRSAESSLDAAEQKVIELFEAQLK